MILNFLLSGKLEIRSISFYEIAFEKFQTFTTSINFIIFRKCINLYEIIELDNSLNIVYNQDSTGGSGERKLLQKLLNNAKWHYIVTI